MGSVWHTGDSGGRFTPVTGRMRVMTDSPHGGHRRPAAWLAVLGAVVAVVAGVLVVAFVPSSDAADYVDIKDVPTVPPQAAALPDGSTGSYTSVCGRNEQG